MNRYYILKIETLIKTFNIIDSGEKIIFEFEPKAENNIFNELKKNDLVLGYYADPIEEIRIFFEIEGINDQGKVELRKKVDVEKGAKIKSEIEKLLEKKEMIEVLEDDFNEIYIELIQNQIRENTEIKSMEEVFKGYLKKQEKAEKTINDYVRELKKWSKQLTEKEVITKEIFKISDSSEFKYFEDELNKLEEFKEWKKERKEKNPNSGLAIEAAIANYRQFLIEYKDNSKSKKEEFIKLMEIEVTSKKIDIPHNYLVFGAPGTGKSHLIDKLQKKYFKERDLYERVTFHSNYSYGNFVGAYKPKMKGKDIAYSYVQGPFIRILEKAFKNPDKNYLLIIEEINRANPAAVFGDIFQLLDRKEGKSEYSIETSEELKSFLAEKFVPNIMEIDNEIEKNEIIEQFNEIYIPSNMYIWATMNSADQGVFPMDTAFKRRWEFEYMNVDSNEDGIKDIVVSLGEGEYKKEIKWNDLRKAINGMLLNEYHVNEDKLIGPYFISRGALENEINGKKEISSEKFREAFKNKVIMYLYEDAIGRQHRKKFFEKCGENITYSNICEKFNSIGVEIFNIGLN